MYRSVFPTFLAFLLTAGSAGAEEMICKGNIISIQGEGMVTRTHRFEVSGISGCDVIAVLEKCKQIAQERQNRAVKKSQGGKFRNSSAVELECTRGSERFEVRRSIQTGR